MKALAAALLLAVGCSSVLAPNEQAGGAGGMAGARNDGGSAGRPTSTGGAAGIGTESAGAAGSSDGGMGGESVGAGGDASDLAGSGGDAAEVQAGTADAGSGGEPNSSGGAGGHSALWSKCNPGECEVTPQTPICGAWVDTAGDPTAFLCTFGCWTLQGTKMAPDAALVAQCEKLGGLCLGVGDYYPVCVPHSP